MASLYALGAFGRPNPSAGVPSAMRKSATSAARPGREHIRRDPLSPSAWQTFSPRVIARALGFAQILHSQKGNLESTRLLTGNVPPVYFGLLGEWTLCLAENTPDDELPMPVLEERSGNGGIDLFHDTQVKASRGGHRDHFLLYNLAEQCASEAHFQRQFAASFHVLVQLSPKNKPTRGRVLGWARREDLRRILHFVEIPGRGRRFGCMPSDLRPWETWESRHDHVECED